MRLSAWEESDRHISLPGGPSFDGRIFHRYVSPLSKLACLDLFSRGWKVKPQAAIKFAELLKEPGFVATERLIEIREVIGENYFDHLGYLNPIEHAEVGNVNGKLVLAIVAVIQTATQLKKVTAIFIDAYGDGQTIHEIHFGAPVDIHKSISPRFSDAIRSIQWADRNYQSVVGI